jgi:hypothetical protein
MCEARKPVKEASALTRKAVDKFLIEQIICVGHRRIEVGRKGALDCSKLKQCVLVGFVECFEHLALKSAPSRQVNDALTMCRFVMATMFIYAAAPFSTLIASPKSLQSGLWQSLPDVQPPQLCPTPHGLENRNSYPFGNPPWASPQSGAVSEDF